MKKIKLLLLLSVFVGLSVPRCEAKDEYYFYKALNTQALSINANIEKTITNKNYKVIANDKKGDFYFIPVQMTFWDWFYYQKARIRSENYFILSTKQVDNDCYLVLSKNYIAAGRKLIILKGINDQEVKLRRIKRTTPEYKKLQVQIEEFKQNTQLARKKMAEKISGGNL